MSFATKAMTSGTRANHPQRAPFATQSANDFSNVAVIDYRPGLNFSSMLANKQPDYLSTASEYKVNLDNNGHTVNMQIMPAKISAPLATAANSPVFLSNEQIADVASRIASELCGKPAIESAAATEVLSDVPPHIARQLEVMQKRIDTLQGELRFDASPPDPSASAKAAAPAPRVVLQQQQVQPMVDDTTHLDAGLRHHTEILRETQRKLDALESDIAYVLAVSGEHAETLDLMDQGLRNQKQEIESSHGLTRLHNEKLCANEERMNTYESEMSEHFAENLRVADECNDSVLALRDEYNTHASMSHQIANQLRSVDAGLQNHRNEIRSLRSEYNTSSGNRTVDQAGLVAAREQMQDTQRQLQAMDSGLTNHQNQIRTLKQDLQSHSTAVNTNITEQGGLVRSLRTGMEQSNSTLSAGLQHHKNELRSMRSDVAAQRQGLDAVRSLQTQSAQSLQNMQAVQSMQSIQNTAASPAQSQLQALQNKMEALQTSLINSQAAPQVRTATNVSRNDLTSFLQSRAQR